MEPSLFVTALMGALFANVLCMMWIGGIVLIHKNSSDALGFALFGFSSVMGVVTVIAFQSPP